MRRRSRHRNELHTGRQTNAGERGLRDREPRPAQQTAVISPDRFSLAALERAVRDGDFPDASARVQALVGALDVIELQMPANGEAETKNGFSRWAAAIACLIADPQFEPPDDFYRAVVLRKRVLADLFAASDLGDTDAMLREVVSRLEGHGEYGRSVLLKLLLSYSLDSKAEFDIMLHYRDAPHEVTDALIGLLGSDVVLTADARSLRKGLTDALPPIAEQVLPFDTLRFLAQPWFLCSYDDWDGKHDVKALLNDMFRRAVESLGVRDVPVTCSRRRVERPTILVPLERFTSIHAVYRCWAPAIRQLRERFRLVAVCDPARLDSRSSAVFDEVLELRFAEQSFVRCLRSVERLRPDIVYYPSIGMSAEVIALANFRLAPIQVMTFGHPATTKSRVMDYAVLEELQLGDPSLLAETVLTLRDGSCQMEMRHDAEVVAPVIRDRADPVRIAVPSTYFKLNPAFLETCASIVERSERAVEFHFFPSAIGPRYHHVRRRIHEVLPAASVYPSTSYVEFVRNLNACDIQLAPFPFGNANSNLDALRQGIPVVTLDSAEVHSRIDGALLRVLGAPDWLVTRSREEYVEVVLRLVNSDGERVGASRAILDRDLDLAHYDSDYRHHPHDFVELFWWLYENHEMIEADGRKVWTPAMREAPAAADIPA